MVADKTLNGFAGFGCGLAVLTLATFAILRWIQIPVGDFVDWLVVGASFFWLVVVVTVPWNIFFQAQSVLADARQSQAKGIPTDPAQIQYVGKVAYWSLRGAVALHLISALGLYILAVAQITAVGYLGSAVALLLTGLRPAVRGYEFLAEQLAQLRQEFRLPRQDALELERKLNELEAQIKQAQDDLDRSDPDSWAGRQERFSEESRRSLAQVEAKLESLRASNELEHVRLSRETQQSVAQLSTDGQFLDHVREILRFFKTA